MRALLLIVLTACTTFSTVASAESPLSQQGPVSHGPGVFTPGGGDLPDLGSPSGATVTKMDEYQYASMVAKQLRDQNALLDDPETLEYLQSIGQRLGAQTPEGTWHFQLFLVKDPEVNAFAVAAGFMFVQYGLVLATHNESELAGVLAHEMAHITQHHLARSVTAQSQQAITSAAAMLAAIILGAVGGGGGGQAIEGGMAAAQGLAAQQQINYTRSNEEEADRVGIGYLYSAGFNTYGMADFFERISRLEGLAATYYPAMLNDHPVTSDRIAEARSRAAQLGNLNGKVQESQNYELIRERLRVITAAADTDVLKPFQVRIKNGETTLAVHYGEALALMQMNRPQEAEKILTKLVNEHQGLTLLYCALGQAQQRAGEKTAAVTTLRHAEELFPRNVPVTVRYAEALMNAGRNAEAHTVLLDLFNNISPTPEQIRLTAMAAAAAGDPGDAYYYMGEYQIAGGELMLAVQQLSLALQTPNLTQVQRQRFAARLKEIRDYLATVRLRRTSDDSGGR
jgi:beta-barrel assembly-enhancing protease